MKFVMVRAVIFDMHPKGRQDLSKQREKEWSLFMQADIWI